MLEPRAAIRRSSTSGRSASSATRRCMSTSAPAPSSPSLSPWPRLSNVRATKPWLAAARAKSRWFSLPEPAPCRTITAGAGSAESGRNSSYAIPSTWPASSGGRAPGTLAYSIMCGIIAATALSHAYPLGTRVNERGHLEVGGCDVVELAGRFGTPAYVYAEDNMRARARAYREAFASRSDDFEVIYASKALPITAAYRLMADEGLSVDVASGGELYLALRAGVAPERIFMHGNNKTEAELRLAFDAGIGYLVLDSLAEIERAESLLDRSSGPRTQDVLIRVTPGIKPSTHSYVQTGHLDSKFGFGLEDGLAEQAVRRVGESKRLNLVGIHAHIGSQIFELEPYTKTIQLLADFVDFDCRMLNVGGGLGIA